MIKEYDVKIHEVFTGHFLVKANSLKEAREKAMHEVNAKNPETEYDYTERPSDWVIVPVKRKIRR